MNDSQDFAGSDSSPEFPPPGPPVVTLPPAPPPLEYHRFRFSGDGKTYFRIWIVNLALTIFTLGIYWAWARIRTRRYLYSCTRVADATFGYHARPVPLLKGYLLLGGLFLTYTLSQRVMPAVASLMVLLFAITWPWIYVKAVRFRARYSSWRGMRFGFDGDFGGSYRVNLFLNFLVPITLGLIYPWIAKERRDYLWNHLRLGSNRFLKKLDLKEFWKTYLIAAGFGLVGMVALMIGMFVVLTIIAPSTSRGTALPIMGLILSGLLYCIMLGLYASLNALVRGRILRHTLDGAHIGGLRLECDLSVDTLCGIEISNLLLTVLTLGFFAPFATIRKSRYVLESITLVVPAGELDRLAAERAADESALGEVASDLLDFEIGL